MSLILLGFHTAALVLLMKRSKAFHRCSNTTTCTPLPGTRETAGAKRSRDQGCQAVRRIPKTCNISCFLNDQQDFINSVFCFQSPFNLTRGRRQGKHGLFGGFLTSIVPPERQLSSSGFKCRRTRCSRASSRETSHVLGRHARRERGVQVERSLMPGGIGGSSPFKTL